MVIYKIFNDKKYRLHKGKCICLLSINGNNLIDFKESSKAESVFEFLEKIVENNKKKIIVLILDNLRAHKTDKTKRKARELGIKLVFLPPYSPDLNPVEFIWKAIKREVSSRFIQSKEHLRNIIKNEFIRMKKSLSLQRSG